LAANLSYAIDPEQFSNKIIRSPNRETLNAELDKMRKISHRWHLVVEFAGTNLRSTDFISRQVKVFGNCILSMLRKQKGNIRIGTQVSNIDSIITVYHRK
jgi:hypothetical protein